MNLVHIESRSSKREEAAYDFFVELDTCGSGDVTTALEEIKAKSSHFNIISRDHKNNTGNLNFAVSLLPQNVFFAILSQRPLCPSVLQSF